MRKVSLLLAFAVAGLSGFAQYNGVYVEKNNDACVKTKAEVKKTSTTNNEVKAPGDILWSEDFSGGLPTGWTLSDAAGVGGWEFNDGDTAYTGAYTDAVDAMIASATHANGYFHLPADFYNCVPGSWPRQMVAVPVDIDATLETDWIDVSGFSAGAILQFDSWWRLCCSEADTKLDINVSTDGATWTTFDGRNVGGIVPINDYPAGANVVSPQYNISSIIAGATQVKFQFRMQGGSHYFWSIDDIRLVEPLNNDMSIIETFAGFAGIYTTVEPSFSDYNTNYSEVPTNIQSYMQLGALIHQAGLDAQNAYVEFAIDSAGTGNVWTSNSFDYMGGPAVIPNFGSVTMVDTVMYTDTTSNFANAYYWYNSSLTASDFTANGTFNDGIPYTFTYNAVSDNADDVPDNNFAVYEYAQTWGRYSYHWQPTVNPTWHSDIGPFSYASPTGAIGDIYANTFDMYQESGDEFKVWGVRIFIPAEGSRVTFDVSGNGVTFVPVIYQYDPAAAAGAGDWVEVVDVTGMPHVLNVSEAASFVYLPFDETEVANYTFTSGRYAIGVRLEDYAGQKVAVGVDQTYRQGDSHFLMKIDPWQDTWYYWGTGGSAMIDIYTQLDQFATDVSLGVETVSTQATNNVKVYPNPTTGVVKVENAENATINVYSIAGNLVKTVQSNSVNTTVDLTGLAKGTYLVKIVKENEVVTKKINLLK